MASQIPDRLMNTQEAAAYLGYSIHTLRAWRKKHTGGPRYHKKPGPKGAVRYRQSTLDKWLKSQEVKPVEIY